MKSAVWAKDEQFLKTNAHLLNKTRDIRFLENFSPATSYTESVDSTFISIRDHKLFGILIKDQKMGIRVLCNKRLPVTAITQNLKHSIYVLVITPRLETTVTYTQTNVVVVLFASLMALHPQYTFFKGSKVIHLMLWTLGI